ncbi:MAG: hypothetical protein LBB80_00070 [Treponema sp.]|jgi:hypothetical protein|nr:hypothetical protein [Treponema sp.]
MTGWQYQTKAPLITGLFLQKEPNFLCIEGAEKSPSPEGFYGAVYTGIQDKTFGPLYMGGQFFADFSLSIDRRYCPHVAAHSRSS